MEKLSRGSNNVCWEEFFTEDHSMYAGGRLSEESDTESDTTLLAGSYHSQGEVGCKTLEEDTIIRRTARERLKDMTKTIPADNKETWMTMNCATCGKQRNVPPGTWNSESTYYCSPPCWEDGTKKEGGKICKDPALRKFTEEFKLITERCKLCPQAFGQDRSWIKEVPAALERNDCGAQATPLGLLKHALSQMNAELEDAKTADAGAAWNDHCRKYQALTDRMIARVEKIPQKDGPQGKGRTKGTTTS